MPKPKLIVLPTSPWSEKARWALDHHHIGYEEVQFFPVADVAWFHVVTRTLRGAVMVPVLVTPHGVVRDSFGIAQHADRVGREQTLFPREQMNAIEQWNRESEGTIAAARVLVIDRMRQAPRAQEQALPPYIPGFARGVLRSMTLVAAGHLARKYDANSDRLAQANRTCDEGLERLRAALGGRDYLLGDGFTYADIAMAVTLQAIVPPANIPMPGEETRAVWTDAARAERFADLLAWRDRLYARHRGR